jgi:sn-glycerol 3-phosphate transport system substrate-binding protein
MGGKKPAEYKGVAKFMAYLSKPECRCQVAHQHRLRADHAGRLRADQASGFYEKNPGTDMPTKQLTNKAPTANSKGLRFGNFVQGRTVIEEETRNVLAGKKDAKTALDDAVKRGNEILKRFEATANK